MLYGRPSTNVCPYFSDLVCTAGVAWCLVSPHSSLQRLRKAVLFGKSVPETKVGVCRKREWPWRLCHVTKGTICSLVCSSVVSSVVSRTGLQASVMDVLDKSRCAKRRSARRVLEYDGSWCS